MRRSRGDLFFEKVSFGLTDEACWIWTAGTNDDGYGCFFDGESMSLAHKWLWERLNGAVPAGLELDHLCRMPSCVKPAHLEPVTHQENMHRSESPVGKRARQTHCLRGHEFTIENTIRKTPNKRECRTCSRMKRRERSERERRASSEQGA